MRLIIVLLLISFTIQAQENPRLPSYLQKKDSTKAGYSFSEGTVYGKSLKMESSRTGGTTLSTGSLGKKPINTLTVRLDKNTTLTTGTVGNDSVEVITFTPDKD
jgi:hypothetical protein